LCHVHRTSNGVVVHVDESAGTRCVGGAVAWVPPEIDAINPRVVRGSIKLDATSQTKVAEIGVGRSDPDEIIDWYPADDAVVVSALDAIRSGVVVAETSTRILTTRIRLRTSPFLHGASVWERVPPCVGIWSTLICITSFTSDEWADVSDYFICFC